MKILILQLARLGDLFMTWPVINGLRRKYPEAEIDILVRRRFQSALGGLDAIDRIHLLPTEQVLAPLMNEKIELDKSCETLEGFINDIKKENYDLIYNFTFSPLSSYLASEFCSEKTEVIGYSRHDDDTLRICDDLSAYFYAQVGVEAPNRVHVSDIMAAMAEVDFIEEDWSGPKNPVSSISLPSEFIVMHVGASDLKKTLAPALWAQALRTLRNQGCQLSVVLIGAPSEKQIGEQIEAQAGVANVINLVGLTTLTDLHSIIQRAQLLIGADSAPIHIASLADTPTFNISSEQVNFWETGPKASLSFIYKKPVEMINGFKLGQIIFDLLQGILDEELIVRGPGVTSYETLETPLKEFQWQLVQALYMGGKYPVAERMEIVDGAKKLYEVNELAIQQLNLIPVVGLENVTPFLKTIDEVILNISRVVPELHPMISWYNAEKVRIAPGTLEDLLAATLNVHQMFLRHLRAYIPQDQKANEVLHGEV